jgi:protein ImuB
MMSADGAVQRVLVAWCPAWEQDPELGTRAFEQVVTVLEGFCPRVEVLCPGACAIGARGPARYFGGEEALARKIIDAVARLGFACQVGVADGLFAAQLGPRYSGARTSAGPAGPRRGVRVGPGRQTRS